MPVTVDSQHSMEKTMKHDLYLRYKFTDRGGRDVYDIFDGDDAKRQRDQLGEIRIPDGQGDLRVELNFNADKSVTRVEAKEPCNCALCRDQVMLLSKQQKRG